MTLIYLLIIFLLLSAFFSAAETAFTSLTDLQVKIIQSKHPIQGKLIAHLFKRPNLFLGSVLIGNNAANFIFSVLSTKLTLDLLGDHALALVTGIMIFIVLVFGEITPKQLAIHFNQQYMLIFIYPLYFFYYCFKPISYMLSIFTKLLYSKKSATTQSNLTGLSHEHFIKMFYQARESGILNNKKVSTVTRILSLEDMSIEHILTHRTEITLLSSKLTLEEAKKELPNYQFSYIPIYENDDQDHIVGIVKSDDIIKLENSNLSIIDIMQKPLFIIENKSIQETIDILRSNNAPLSVVLDEYGGLHGIVTMKDIMSFIFDDKTNSPKHKLQKNEAPIKKIKKHQFKIKGTTKLSSVSEMIGIPLDSSIEALTIAGYIQEITGTLPTLGKTISTPYGKMYIEEIEDNRIISLIWTLESQSDKDK